MPLDIADGTIQTVRSIVNPDKLGHLGALANRAELAGQAKATRRTSDNPARSARQPSPPQTPPKHHAPSRCSA
jgi:hypothetical protein